MTWICRWAKPLVGIITWTLQEWTWSAKVHVLAVQAPPPFSFTVILHIILQDSWCKTRKEALTKETTMLDFRGAGGSPGLSYSTGETRGSGTMNPVLFSVVYEFSVMVSAAAAKSLQSCPTLCDTIDGSPPGFPVPGILQARILEWVAISFSNAWKWNMKVKSLSCVWLLATPWTAAYQAPLSMGFSRQEY